MAIQLKRRERVLMEKTDQEIVGKCVSNLRSGKEFRREFSVLVRRYSRLVFTVVLSMVWDYHRAEEIVQDVFLKAYGKFHTFDRRRNFTAWICKIAKSCCIDFLRKNRLQPLSLDEILIDSKAIPKKLYHNNPTAEVNEMRRKINRAILSLPEGCKEVAIMRFLENMSYREIARNLGLPETTARTRLFRARKILHESLKPLMDQLKGGD